jgi:hypothetical protein
MHTDVSKRPLPRWLSGGLVLLAGCAGAGTVSGTVTYKGNGKKLMSGTVMILSGDSVPRYGQINEDGSFAVPEVPRGRAKVTVTSPGPQDAGPERAALRGAAGRGRSREQAQRPTPASGLSESATKGWFAIPDRYADPALTPLTVEVKGGKNVLPIELDP